MTTPTRWASPTVLVLATSILGCLSAPAAHAQTGSVLELLPTDGRTLALDEEVSGGLSSSDLFGPDGERMEAWTLEGSAGQAVTIDLRSEEFDASLYLVGPGLGEGLRDDDGGAGCDARIELTFLETGTYTVVASSTFADATGVYALAARTDADPIVDYPCGGANPAALRALPIEADRNLAVGTSASGSLDGSEPVVEDGRGGEAWTLEADAGDRATIRLLSDAFDPYLYALGPGMDLVSDDDGGGNRNAQLELEFPESGTYLVVVSSFGDGAQGGYTLEVLPPADVAELPVAGRIQEGEAVSGTLAMTAPPLFDGRPAQLWEFVAEAGQRVAVELISEAFDTYLYLTGPGLTTPLEDDDGAGDLNSRIEASLPESGTYRIVVSAYSAGSEGDFELSLTEAP